MLTHQRTLESNPTPLGGGKPPRRMRMVGENQPRWSGSIFVAEKKNGDLAF